MSKKGAVIGLMGLIGLMGCQEISPEQQAAEAAQGYYQRLLMVSWLERPPTTRCLPTIVTSW